MALCRCTRSAAFFQLKSLGKLAEYGSVDVVTCFIRLYTFLRQRESTGDNIQNFLHEAACSST